MLRLTLSNTFSDAWHPSLGELAWLILILLASAMTFAFLALREGKYRSRRWIIEFARRASYRLFEPDDGLPDQLNRISQAGVQTLNHFGDDRVRFVRFNTFDEAGESSTWHAMTLHVETPGKTMALRPTSAQRSLVDFFEPWLKLEIEPGARFGLVAQNRSDALWLGQSQARALTPADLSVLRLPNHVVIDFSARPFDEVELRRIEALAQQLSRVL